MAIRALKPTTPAQRGMTTQDFDQITVRKPLKSLLVVKTRKSGRNNQGRITTRHKGGGKKQFYRLVDFKLAPDTKATIEAIEYDPNRSARIARIKDQDGKYHYILAANGARVGKTILVGAEVAISNSNRLPLKGIPLGSQIHAIEIQPGKGAQMVRSAGTSAQLVAKENGYGQVKLPSGEVRLFLLECFASVGTVGNNQHQNVKIGKAGRNRNKGIRPSVRGVVMGAYDHPHGGGDGGKHGIGGGKSHGSAPRTPWGQKTLGYKTRSRKKNNRLIMRKRSDSKRR
ncbi:MAG TPA: 50S ribosomal protein L2 [Candidatus Saccharimonadales bacterium]|nr:50S ribosomal protein L2 [Candidatus Saccharimonadales bacterium]